MGIIRNAARRPPDSIPTGWHSADEWSQKEGLSNPQCRRYIRELVESGKWQVRKYNVLRSEVVRPVPYYAPKNVRS